MKSAASPSQADLRYCLDVLLPRASELEDVEWASLAPWRWRRWYRANKEHRAINRQWARILKGKEGAP